MRNICLKQKVPAFLRPISKFSKMVIISLFWIFFLEYKKRFKNEKNDFKKILNKWSNSYTRIYTFDAKSFNHPE